jgi:hypothetical protein
MNDKRIGRAEIFAHVVRILARVFDIVAIVVVLTVLSFKNLSDNRYETTQKKSEKRDCDV